MGTPSRNPGPTGAPTAGPNDTRQSPGPLGQKHTSTVELEIYGTKTSSTIVTYTHSGYSVTMQTDGAILVKQGDRLSKYSAAIYDDFTRVNEFAAMWGNSGKLHSISDVNSIHPGQTIYHIPTYNAYQRRVQPLRLPDMTVLVGPPLSEEEKSKIIVDTLKDDYGLKGNQLDWIDHNLHKLELLLHGLGALGDILKMWNVIKEETKLAEVAEWAEVAGYSMTPIVVGIAVLNAEDSDRKVAGMWAVCYTLTAWAFDAPIPGFPKSVKDRLSSAARSTAYFNPELLPRMESAWRESSAATVRNLEARVAALPSGPFQPRETKEQYQFWWQWIGDWNRNTLVRLLMENFPEVIELSDVEKINFSSLDPDSYPN